MLLMLITFILATILVVTGIILLKGLTARQIKFLIKVLGLFAVSSVVVLILALVMVVLF